MSALSMPEEFREAAQHINDLTESGLDVMTRIAVADQLAHWLDIAAEQWEQDPLQIDAEECDEMFHPAIAIAKLINGSAS